MLLLDVPSEELDMCTLSVAVVSNHIGCRRRAEIKGVAFFRLRQPTDQSGHVLEVDEQQVCYFASFTGLRLSFSLVMEQDDPADVASRHMRSMARVRNLLHRHPSSDLEDREPLRHEARS